MEQKSIKVILENQQLLIYARKCTPNWFPEKVVSFSIMTTITNSFATDVLLALVTVVYLVYQWYIRNNDYWDKRGVLDTKIEFFVRMVQEKQTAAEQGLEFYRKLGDERFGGFLWFRKPAVVIKDPKLIRKIMVDAFHYFEDRGEPFVKHDPLTQNLFFLRGYTWRALRRKLTPTFTVGKLRGMFDQFSECGDRIIERIKKQSRECTVIEAKTFLFEYTLEGIASTAFGIQMEPNSPEFEKFKTSVERIFLGGPLMALRFAIIMFFPKLGDLLRIPLFPINTGNYFVKLTKSTLKYRKDNNIKRNDYFQLLIDLKEQEEFGKDTGLKALDTKEDDLLVKQLEYMDQNEEASSFCKKLFTDESICGNTFIFLLAGSESTAAIANLVLFELARHADIQLRVQQEVDSALAKYGSWSFEAVRDMTYLDQVIQEVQRFYPAQPVMTRKCVRTFKVPDSNFTIEKGMVVAIPVIGLHMDPLYHEDPDKFNPDRFEGNIFKPSPFYLPYGDGPRMCIGMRFAVLQMKTCVAKIMSQFSMTLDSKTKLPLEFQPTSVVPYVKDGLWLKFEKREKTNYS